MCTFAIPYVSICVPMQTQSSLVLSTLNEALAEEPDRKCFRLIGGVLVERTVQDVVPALQTNRDGVSLRESSTLPVVNCSLFRSARSLLALPSNTRPRKEISRSLRESTKYARQEGCKVTLKPVMAPSWLALGHEPCNL
jgi:Prefoldin subunit